MRGKQIEEIDTVHNTNRILLKYADLSRCNGIAAMDTSLSGG